MMPEEVHHVSITNHSPLTGGTSSPTSSAPPQFPSSLPTNSSPCTLCSTHPTCTSAGTSSSPISSSPGSAALPSFSRIRLYPRSRVWVSFSFWLAVSSQYSCVLSCRVEERMDMLRALLCGVSGRTKRDGKVTASSFAQAC